VADHRPVSPASAGDARARSAGSADAGRSFPLGARVTLEQLDEDPYPILAALREREPVSWLPALDGWLVTRYDLARAVVRDPATFTVEDPRFSTGQIIGPSMLSLDGEAHARHRAPFTPPFRPTAVRERFAAATAAEALRLVDRLPATGAGELRRSFAGPLAASIIARALGLEQSEVGAMLAWYDAIVAAVTEVTAGHDVPIRGRQAFAALRERLTRTISDTGHARTITDTGHASLLTAAATGSSLDREQIVSNAAVLLFGGIETTEGMIANALLHLVQTPAAVTRLEREPSRLDAAIEESLRLEPAAAVVDRYATADTTLAGANITRGELVRVSITAANRDPARFPDPDRFDLDRAGARGHLAFAHGPHVCVGVHLARLEARTAIAIVLDRLPGLRLDPDRPSAVRGLVFRKPPALNVLWQPPRPV
jgi:cytochrome P450